MPNVGKLMHHESANITRKEVNDFTGHPVGKSKDGKFLCLRHFQPKAKFWSNVSFVF
jgi:hypothetical protein